MFESQGASGLRSSAVFGCEFRANNITLANQLAEQKKRFDGIDPDEARKLAEEKQMRAARSKK